MPALLAAVIADIRALRESWSSVRGGWPAAWQDAAQLIRHRRVLVDTCAMTPDGTKVVLRTRLRLSGDTQTDVLRIWFDSAAPELIDKKVQEHFQKVAAAMGGFAAALGMERLIIRFTMLLGTVGTAGGVAATIRTLLKSEAASWPHIVLSQWWLLLPIAVALIGVVARSLLRRRLRARFEGGLTASDDAGSAAG